jgi:hypothetical protein
MIAEQALGFSNRHSLTRSLKPVLLLVKMNQLLSSSHSPNKVIVKMLSGSLDN